MDRPDSPPDAVLLRTVREAVGLSTAEVARKAGISPVRLTQIENGCEKRGGRIRPVRARPGTFAHVAHAIGITAGRLESEGVRPDAVGILREIEHQEEEERARAAGQEAEADTPEPSSTDAIMDANAAAINALLSPVLREVQDEVDHAKRRARMRDPEAYPDGHDIFSDPIEAEAWNLSRDPDTEDQRTSFVAWVRYQARQAQEASGRPRNVR